ncbi:hypothetical protein ALT721_680021 [Alteromonas alvinellae]
MPKVYLTENKTGVFVNRATLVITFYLQKDDWLCKCLKHRKAPLEKSLTFLTHPASLK